MRYNNYKNKDDVYKSIKDLVLMGMDTLKAFSAESTMDADTWMDYSEKIVGVVTKDFDNSIHLNYLRLLLSIRYDNKLSPEKKITLCLEYLMEVLNLMLELA